MQTAVVSSKYQIVIPKAIRERMDIRQGQEVSFEPLENELRLVIVPSIEELAGKFPQLKRAPGRSELWKDDKR
ncbi:AbrB/MazE/SpoVT family DNA-binding domain-containing protein [Candidatus Micrarchaeota archaeon]|nr:AbrB/MazE/SpoVT family DNA-binding domain-containing protein [Candidatus Micrarchaeota archaeon]MBI5177302.1 AbrB/MazE/SpoVT family DNA-binding domain-containing protein [Candidatus Micrarchaeota archaeon]